MFRGRRRCRSCKRQVCEKCSKSKVKLSDTGKKAVRTCDACVRELNAQSDSATEKTGVRSTIQVNSPVKPGERTKGHLRRRHAIFFALMLVSLVARVILRVPPDSEPIIPFTMEYFVLYCILTLRKLSSPLGFVSGLLGLILYDEVYTLQGLWNNRKDKLIR